MKKFLGSVAITAGLGTIKSMLDAKEDRMEECDNDVADAIAWREGLVKVSPNKELEKWNYTLDAVNNTITLNYLDSDVTDIVVYPEYVVGDIAYRTIISNAPAPLSRDNKYMFNAYNNEKIQNLESITFEPGIDTSNLTDISYMFSSAGATYSIESKSKVTSVNGLENIDVSNVKQMAYLFAGLQVETLDLSTWNTSNVVDMGAMFYRCSKLTDIKYGDGFITSNVVGMNAMFFECNSLTSIPLAETFDVSNVRDIGYMFQMCYKLNTLDISKWNASNVEYMDSTFTDTAALRDVDLSVFNGTIKSLNMTFYGSGLTDIDLTSMDLSQLTGKMVGTFASCTHLKSVKFPQCTIAGVTSINILFQASTAIETIDLSPVRFTGIESAVCSFWGCTALKTVIAPYLITSACTDMREMFTDSSALETLDVSTWDTSNVTNMDKLFYNKLALKSIVGLENWDVSNVEEMGYLFGYCTVLTSINISTWNTAKAKSMDYMFAGCRALSTYDLRNFVFENVVGNVSNFLYDNAAPTQIYVKEDQWNLVKDEIVFWWGANPTITFV